MLAWIDEELGYLSMAPWLRPCTALTFAVLSSLLGWAVSNVPWATVTFAISLGLAVWTFTESLACTMRGFVAGLVAFTLLPSLENTLTIFRVTPHGCVAIERKTANRCIEEIRKRLSNRIGNVMPPFG